MLAAWFIPSLLGCGMMEAQTKDGTKVFLFAPGEQVIVSVNGEDPATLDSYVGLGLGPGTHSIAVQGGPEVSVTLEPFDELVVPLAAGQCFMSLDVSQSNYGGGKQSVPKIAGRMQRSAPFKMPKGHYHSEAALPQSITSGQQVFLLRSMACHAADDLEFGLKGKVTREDGSTDPVATSVALVRRSACKAKEQSDWCTSLRGWNSVQSSPLPQAPQSFIGLSVAAPAGTQEIELDPSAMPLSVLSINAEGMEISGLEASNPKEEGELALVSQGIAQVLSGEREVLSVDANLATYLAGQAQAAAKAPGAQGPGWAVEGSEVRQVGGYWLSVEPLPEGEGHYVSLHSPYKLLPN